MGKLLDPEEGIRPVLDGMIEFGRYEDNPSGGAAMAEGTRTCTAFCGFVVISEMRALRLSGRGAAILGPTGGRHGEEAEARCLAAAAHEEQFRL